MKNKILSLFTLLLVTGVFTSCDNGDDVDAIVQVEKPTMTINFPTAVTVTEGDVIPFTVNLSKPVGHEFSLFIVLDRQGSTAGDLDSDVENGTTNVTYQKVITIPPFVTSYSSSITIYEDELAEPTETLKLAVGDTRTSAVKFQPVVSTITINNKIDNELKLDFHFDKTFTGVNGYTNSLCKLASGTVKYDIDFLLWDPAFNDTGNTDAQTAACTESMTIKLATYPNGLYHVIAQLYSNAGLNTAIGQFPLVGTGDFDIPITVDYLRAGSINKATYAQEEPNWFSATTPLGSLSQVVDVNISTVGGVRKFTIQNTLNTTTFATGKMNNKGKYVSKNKK